MFNKNTSPILFVIFNRLETTKVVFNAIKEAKPKYLYIAADGPRESKIGEAELCNEVRNFVLDNIDWECEVKTNFSKVNLGCGYGPKSAISWFFENVTEGIILEDDCVPDTSFFQFCSILLEKYRDDNRIAIISGCNFDVDSKYSTIPESYFFSKIPYTWGWATWRRNWEQYDYKIQKWGDLNKNKFLKHLFDNIEFQLSWKKVFDDIYAQTPSDIWDYQFFFSCFMQSQLSIVPHRNLISNIGHGDFATHTFSKDSAQANLSINKLEFPLVHPSKVERNFDYDIFLQELCFGRIEYISIPKRIKRYIKRLLKKSNI